MAETETVWMAHFDADNNVVVESYEAKLTAKRVRVEIGSGVRIIDRDKLHTSREEALHALRTWTQHNLRFAQGHVDTATKQLKNLDAFEKPRKYTLDGRVP